MNMKLFYFIALYITSQLGFNSLVTAEAKNNPIKIAANLPLSGELATYGTAIRDGAILALEGSDTSNIEIDWEDNLGNNATAFSVLKRQLLNHPEIYISGLKPQTMTIERELSKLGIPHFEWVLDVSVNSNSNNNLRTWINFKLEAEQFLKYLSDHPVRRVAMLYTALPAAETQFNKIIAPELRRLGAKEIWIESYPLDTGDFKSLGVKVKQFNPDTIILNGFASQLMGLIKTLRSYDLIKDGNTLASLDMIEAANLMTKEESEGIIVAAPTYLFKTEEALQKKWRSKFKDRFGKEPLYHSAFAYDMITIIKDVLKRIGNNSTEKDLLSTLRSTNKEGITGHLAFDEDGSLLAEMRAAKLQGGMLH